MNTLLRLTSTAICLAALLWMTGCASTQKRYDKAEDLELQGRYAARQNTVVVSRSSVCISGHLLVGVEFI